MTRKMGLILLGLGVVFFSACTEIAEDNYETGDVSDYESRSDNSGSCYNESRAGCAYYYNMSDSEIGTIEQGCSSSNQWSSNDNICDGNTQYSHWAEDPDDSYVTICTNSYLGGTYKAYLYGISSVSAEYNRKACIDNGGTSEAYKY